MTAGERGFLLLTAFLGDPDTKPLTLAQFRKLAQKARMMQPPETDRELVVDDIVQLSLEPGIAERVVGLLQRESQLDWYLEKARKKGVTPITRISAEYPVGLHRSLGLDAPGALWCLGDLSILKMPRISVVGSRDLCKENETFAWEAGKQAALQGYALVSGNARGADKAAQEGCLAHGGKVISIVADTLETKTQTDSVLYISETGFDLPFSSYRALQRNRIIHAISSRTLIAQCSHSAGGTWEGTVENLRHGYSQVLCYHDTTDAMSKLVDMGGQWVTKEQLTNLDDLAELPIGLI